MIRFVLCCAAALASTRAAAEIVYAGTLGTQPIHLVIRPYADGVVRAIYVYDRHDTPIGVDGRLADGVLELREGDARLRFEHFDPAAAKARGEWRAPVGDRVLPIALERVREIGGGASLDSPVELLQAASTPEHYFATVVDAGEDAAAPPRVVAVKVYRKRSDALVQTLPVEVEFRGVDSVSIGDFNFDGRTDFAVFEASAAGPNTTSLYMLREPGAERYARSAIAGVSLEFDAVNKRVREHNVCCAGTSHEEAVYRVVAKALELESRRCWTLDDAGATHERPCD